MHTHQKLGMNRRRGGKTQREREMEQVALPRPIFIAMQRNQSLMSVMKNEHMNSIRAEVKCTKRTTLIEFPPYGSSKSRTNLLGLL